MDAEVSRSQFSDLVQYSRAMMTAAGIFTLLIMIVGVMGNLLTIIALVRNAKIRTVAAAFIANLCVSDLMFCFLVLPFSASQFFHGTWIHGDVLCVMIPLLRYGCVGISLLSIAAISINRYILIAVPQLYTKIYTKFKVIVYISIIWLFSYGIQIPTLLGVLGTYGFDEKLGTCSIKEDENGNSPKSTLFLIGFGLPCIVIVVCYLKIYLVVKKSHQRLKQHNTTTTTTVNDNSKQQNQQQQQQKTNFKRSEMKITKMVLVIFVCFLVCYLPITIVKIFDQDVEHAPLQVICYLLIYISACVNPVVYVTMNKQYRQAYLNTIKCTVNSNIFESQQQQQQQQNNTQSPPSRLSVGYLKNIVNQTPKV